MGYSDKQTSVSHENHNEPSKTVSKNHALRNKEFVLRNSLLDDLMQNQHIATVYRLFLALLVGSVIHLTVYQYFSQGQINFGQRLIVLGFQGFHRFAVVWIGLFVCNFIVYNGFAYWATVRTRLADKTSRTRLLWDWLWLSVFVAYLNGWLFIATWIVLKQNLTILLTIIAACEITRMTMKCYAFVRSNVPRVLEFKPHSNDSILFPAFSQFMYFLWIPTLIYRDSYPRSKHIRWNYIAVKAIEFIAGAFFMSVTIEHYIITPFKDYGKQPTSWSDILVIYTENAACGLIVSVTGFYMVLHVWMGAFAELCKFGDRSFYQDWWTSPNFERFWRTWNVVIHDWLYTYVYKDLHDHVLRGNKVAVKLIAFFISAIFHEYILYTSFGFVLPVVFIQFFIFSTFFTFFKFKPDAFGNILILYGIGLGNGFNYASFGLEYYARLNCPIENPTIVSYLIPRLFSCGTD